MEIDITINLYTYHRIESMFSFVCVCVCVCAMCIDSLGIPLVKATTMPYAKTSSLPQVVEYTSHIHHFGIQNLP